MNLVASLCQLAAGGRSIITTIHQVGMGMHRTCCIFCAGTERVLPCTDFSIWHQLVDAPEAVVC